MNNETFTPEIFTKFQQFIREVSGISYTEENAKILESRLRWQMLKEKVSSYEEYLAYLKRDPIAKDEFVSSVTTTLTHFFRNQAHFTTLEKVVLPILLMVKRKEKLPIRVWSAGCSTGEEPYSIAMLFKECCPPEQKFEITATDINGTVLQTAEEGTYKKERIANIEERYKKYFQQSEDGHLVEVAQEIKDYVNFDYFNLHDELDKEHYFDLIFCRNVLIYFDKAGIQDVVRKFYQASSSPAFLFIGHSETLSELDTKYTFYNTDFGHVYTKDLVPSKGGHS